MRRNRAQLSVYVRFANISYMWYNRFVRRCGRMKRYRKWHDEQYSLAQGKTGAVSHNDNCKNSQKNRKSAA